MKKCELLVPAGNMECLRQAVYNGCDAVYLACKNFGARKFANNFTNEEIIEAVKFCHLYGVKVYITMNILIKNNEVDAFLEQACFLHEHGVDALIVQDFGMICLLREKYPNLEIHASTQANISSSDVCQLYHDLGVKRVVFARELSIDEIDSIDVDIEKEVFIHGALCISYSGCCLMSSMLGGRSGNRGECAGTCRTLFSLEKDGHVLKSNYLLSTKELNTSSNIERILNSSICSLKIEGRMKGPLYVGFITRLYRRLIDGEDFNLDAEINKLKTIYNRDFTVGRLFDASDEELMNIFSPNHIGLTIGKVIGFYKDKIKIKLNNGCTLNQNDAIKFLDSDKGFVVNYLYDKNLQLTNSIDDIGYVDNKCSLNTNSDVSKTYDYLLEREVFHGEKKKIPVSFSVVASLNDGLSVSISDGESQIEAERYNLEESLNCPATAESITKQLNRLVDTPFTLANVDINIEPNLFIPVKLLNDIRRELVNKLIVLREGAKKEVVVRDIEFIKNQECINNNKCISASVMTEEQLQACFDSNVDIIYINDSDLYKKYSNHDKVYYAVDRFLINVLDNIKNKSLVGDYANYSDYDVRGNYTLNVTNIYSAYYLRKIGLKSICLSVELTDKEIYDFVDLYYKKFGYFNFECLVYGSVLNMIIKGNILDIDSNHLYKLVDFKKRKFPVYYDGKLTHIFNYSKISINNICNYTTLRFDFLNEKYSDVLDIVKKYKY